MTCCDKIKQLKRRECLRPLLLIVLLQFFGLFNGSRVWEAYIVQVAVAFGAPIKSNFVPVLTSALGVVGTIFIMLTVKRLGRRPIFLTASVVMALACVGLSMP